MLTLISKLIGGDTEKLLPAHYTVAPGVKSSEHPRGFAILHVETGQIHLCQGAAARMWSGLVAGKTPLEIADSVSHENTITKELAICSVRSFLQDILMRRLIVPEIAEPSVSGSALLSAQALWELVKYDLRVGLFGFRAIHRALESLHCRATSCKRFQPDIVERIIRIVSVVSSLHWRPVRCLQSSVVAARLLRKFGIPAQVVIGYCTDPFFSHAWVEVNGRVVNGSAALPRNLVVLHRI